MHVYPYIFGIRRRKRERTSKGRESTYCEIKVSLEKVSYNYSIHPSFSFLFYNAFSSVQKNIYMICTYVLSYVYDDALMWTCATFFPFSSLE